MAGGWRAARPVQDPPGGCRKGISEATVDIVLPVHDALDDVQACLASVRRTATGNLGRVWLVDDCSGPETAG